MSASVKHDLNMNVLTSSFAWNAKLFPSFILFREDQQGLSVLPLSV